MGTLKLVRLHKVGMKSYKEAEGDATVRFLLYRARDSI